MEYFETYTSQINNNQRPENAQQSLKIDGMVQSNQRNNEQGRDVTYSIGEKLQQLVM